MTNFMKTALVSTAILAGSAAFAITEVRTVNVTVDLEAIGNERAAQYWTDVADDLETEIVSRLTNQISDDGVSVNIDIEELSLATAFQENFGIEDTKLVGQVSILDLTDNSKREFYELTINYDQAASFIPTTDGIVAVISMTDKGYYNGMIEAFANNVVAKLQ